MRGSVTIERGRPGAYARMQDVRPLAHEPELEVAVERETGERHQRHLQRDARARLPVEQREQRHQAVPEHAVAEAAHDAEGAAHEPEVTGSVRETAAGKLEDIHARE